MSDFDRSAISLLEKLAKGSLPESINSKTVDISVFQELYRADFISAIDCSSYDGTEYMDPKITHAGRQYLDELKSKRKSFWFKWSGGWEIGLAILGGIATIVGAVAAFM